MVLVPYRGGDTFRAVAWAHVQEQLFDFGWPIYVSDSAGPWSRAEAINRASLGADEQQPWDIAVIADADTIHNPVDVRRGVVLAAKLQTLVVPWRTRWKLSQAGTEKFYQHGPSGYTAGDLDMNDHTRVRMPPKVRGGTTIVPRSVWDRVGGFDEGFVEWGHEDVAFRMAASTLTPGRLNELLGTVWHLWHPRTTDHDWRESNNSRLDLYGKADGSRIKMTALLQQLEVVAS